ncbi:uncharacterized protein LOC117642083 isoform X2 [Thrips palmi]|nr:uncharacterized protein LOC117642083 isoform X2 [Thrips palmi]XP_034235798.1 uncharacterized protein LOC117642083 isoform X2 [Thrips palmi]
MATSNQVYKEFTGSVVEFMGRYKAIVELHDLKQRALLKVEKFTCKLGLKLGSSEDHAINEFVDIGSTIKCLCHKYDETAEHKCAWFIAEVLSVGHELSDPRLLSGLCPTMLNRMGWVSHLEKRQGVITFKDDNGDQQEALFLASKFYDGGKHIKVKTPLEQFIAVNDKISFDAVPIDPEENEHSCSWFATLAWKRSKPAINYDAPTPDPDPNLAQIKMIVKNPKSHFIRGKGQIMQILSEGYGIALGAVNKQQTHWQSILFHRSCASLFKYNLGKVDIRKVFKEGDKVRFIAAAAPKGFSAQWVASHISIDVIGDARKLIDGL